MPLTIFAPNQIDSMVSNLLGPLPKGHTIAVVAAVDAKGIPIGVTFLSKDGHWQAEGVFRYDYSGDKSVGGKVMWSR